MKAKIFNLLLLISLGTVSVFSQPTVEIGPPGTTLANSSGFISFTITYTDANSVILDETYVEINHSGTSGGTKYVTGTGTDTREVTIYGILGDGSFTIELLAGSSSNGDGADTGAGPSQSVNIDNTPPDPPVVSGITDGFFNTNQTFTVAGEAGATIEYSINGGADWLVYTTGVTLSAEGTYSVTARQTDQAGNLSNNAAVITLSIDTTDPAAPVISGISAGSYNTNQTFTLTGESGATIEYSLDGGTGWSGYSGAVILSAEGTYDVTARQTDLAGNLSASSVTITLTIDKTKPAAPVITGISAGSYNTDQTFTVAGEAGATIEYSINGGADWSDYTGDVTLSAEGTYSVTARQTDQAGNLSNNPALISLTIDKTPPVITSVTVPAGVYRVGDVIAVTIVADGGNYSGSTVSVNGKPGQTLINNNDNTYKINYTVQEGDNELEANTSMQVEIVLSDQAGNLNVPVTSADVLPGGGTITVDSSIPVIESITSNGEAPGILSIGDELVFTVTMVEAEEGLILTPVSYNSIGINWVSSGGGKVYTAVYTVGENHATQDPPLQIGTITVEDAAGNSSSGVYSGVQKTIYATRPAVSISGSASKCYDGLAVTVTFLMEGYPPFDLTYNDGSGVVNIVTADFTHTVEVTAPGTYEFSLVELSDSTGNITYAASGSASVEIKPLPSVSFVNLPVLYTIDQDPVDLKPFATPQNGLFSGPGVTGATGFFYPSLAGEEDQTVQVNIKYTYTDPGTGCSNSTEQTVTVSSGAAILGLSSVYCNYEDEQTVTGTNPDGVTGQFTVTPSEPWVDTSSGLIADGNTLTVIPGLLVAGDPSILYTVRYSYEKEGQLIETEETFRIDSLGVDIDFVTLEPGYCEDHGALTLTAVNLFPSGGTGFFSGPDQGFSLLPNPNTALFEPAGVTPDQTYEINYYYETVNGCLSDVVTRQTTVHSLPAVDFVIRDNLNFDEPPIPLSGNFDGGVFSATAGIVVDNILYPDRTLPGPINVSYYYQDPATQCANTIVKPSTIRKASEMISGIADTYCYSDDVIQVSCVPLDDGTVIGQFFSNKGAVTSGGPNQASYSIAQAGHGTDTLFYRYFIGDTPYEVYAPVLIDSIGPVSVLGLEQEYCDDDQPVLIQGYLDNPPQGSRSFVYSGDPLAFNSTGGVATLSPAFEEPGIYDITFTFISELSGCSRAVTEQVTINPLPDVSLDLPSFYNIDQPPLDLDGEPEGGSFSGEGVLADRFNPLEAGTGDANVQYTYTDDRGCVNSISEIITVVGADGAITGLPQFACIDTEAFAITGSSVNGLAGEFTGNGITNTAPDSALFDPAMAGKGIHTITYRYIFSGDGETELFIRKEIEVDSLGIVEIFGLREDMTYCANDPSLILTASPAGGIFSGGDHIIGNRYHPSLAGTGISPVVYTLTNTRTGCSISGVDEVTVHPVPRTAFLVVQSCSDLATEPVDFINITVSDDPVADWLWRFDSEGTASSTLESPGFIYSSAGSKLVTLTATTDKGCSASKDSIINVGLVPKADFSWQNECLTGDVSVFSATSDPASIVSYTWEFGDGTTYSGGTGLRTISHLFAETGEQNVRLIITSADNCADTTDKRVYIHPLIAVNSLPGSYYSEDFESGRGFWDARAFDVGGHSSWDYGFPDGDLISYSASGENSWFTGISFSNQRVEKSQVLSPCFDLRSLEKPMLKFNIWSLPEAGRDGAVLQYDLNGSNEWQNLGTIEEGINWFNSSTIQSQPGGQFLGWSSRRMEGWESARISLDEISDASNVRFRIAYAADGNALNPFDGFAFDDIWIGNRKKEVLIEYFTNYMTGITEEANSYMKEFHDRNISDVRAVHYHTSNPGGDSFYSYYPSGPTAREFFYGVSTIPYALANGSIPINLSTTAGNQQMMSREMLKDPLFEVSIEFSDVNERIKIVATALEEVSGSDLIMHCAIVQKAVGISDNSNGTNKFYNVLRQFLPDPGGTSMPGTMSAGQAITETFAWDPHGTGSPEQMRVVAFIQDAQTGLVYQSGFLDLAGIITFSVPAGAAPEIKLYPNPATSVIWIDSPVTVESIVITDITGRAVAVHKADNRLFSIPVRDLKNGVYIINIRTEQETIVRRFVKQ